MRAKLGTKRTQNFAPDHPAIDGWQGEKTAQAKKEICRRETRQQIKRQAARDIRQNQVYHGCNDEIENGTTERAPEMNVTRKKCLVAVIDIDAARGGQQKLVHRRTDDFAAEDVTKAMKESGYFHADEIDEC